MKKYKGFYPSWYIEKRNNDGFKKFKGYLTLILIANLLLAPNMIKREKELNLEIKKKVVSKEDNILEELDFLLTKNIDDFIIENNRLEFKMSKTEFKENFKDLEKKVSIRSVEEILEDVFLIKGEFYDK